MAPGNRTLGRQRTTERWGGLTSRAEVPMTLIPPHSEARGKEDDGNPYRPRRLPKRRTSGSIVPEIPHVNPMQGSVVYDIYKWLHPITVH